MFYIDRLLKQQETISHSLKDGNGVIAKKNRSIWKKLSLISAKFKQLPQPFLYDHLTTEQKAKKLFPVTTELDCLQSSAPRGSCPPLD